MSNLVDSFLDEAGKSSKERYEKGGHILDYGEYLRQVSKSPRTHLRDAAAFIKDMFDYYGTREVSYPWGKIERFVLFDQPFATRAEALMGQEEAQQIFYRLLQSFVRAGKAHRLIMLHGSNGSSKSTFVGCIGRGMENYSTTDEGAIYRFNWIFPSEKTYSSKLGFMQDEKGRKATHGTFAHLDETEIEAKLPCELKDHPLLILPVEERRKFLDRVIAESGVSIMAPELLLRGGVCPKCRLIFDALLVSYRGDLGKVLNHVQVERYTISRRYSRGFVSVGPQMSVDGGERQVTMDRTLSALPKILQNISFFEPYGDLVDGSGGLIEFSDLLKRPVEAFKYLLETIETGEAQLGQSMHRINAVLVATSNEIHLNNFKQHPDALSFMGRFSMIKMPYILSEPVEGQIYETQVVPGLGKHVSPHAVELASSWAVQTRLFKPNADRFSDPLKGLVKELMCTEKFDIYSEGKIPSRFSSEETKLLANAVDKLFHETDNMPVYEGITGASPREVKSIIYLASQNPAYECLTPMAVLEELEAFIRRTKDYSFLNMEKKEGHYHDFKHFVDILKIRFLQKVLSEVVESSHIFAERQFEDLWDRYVIHASTWIKGEKIFNPVTKKHEDPDEALMDKVEGLLEVKNKKEFREENLSRIAAAAIEKRHSAGHYAEIFFRYVDIMKARLVRESLPRLKDLVEQTLGHLSGAEGGGGAQEAMPEEIRKFYDDFQSRFGYCPHCARAVLGFFMREKLAAQE